MRLVTDLDSNETTFVPTTERDWPRAARAASLSLETARMPRIERRAVPRHRYRAVGFLTVDAPSSIREPAEIYIREVNPWTVSFLATRPYSTSEHADIQFFAPDGTEINTRCLIRRCREFIPGWFDCVAQLDQQQPLLSLDSLNPFTAI